MRGDQEEDHGAALPPSSSGDCSAAGVVAEDQPATPENTKSRRSLLTSPAFWVLICAPGTTPATCHAEKEALARLGGKVASIRPRSNRSSSPAGKSPRSPAGVPSGQVTRSYSSKSGGLVIGSVARVSLPPPGGGGLRGRRYSRMPMVTPGQRPEKQEPGGLAPLKTLPRRSAFPWGRKRGLFVRSGGCLWE